MCMTAIRPVHCPTWHHVSGRQRWYHDGYVCMVAAPPLSSISPALIYLTCSHPSHLLACMTAMFVWWLHHHSHPSHLLSSISPACLHDGYVCMVAAPPLSSISPALIHLTCSHPSHLHACMTAMFAWWLHHHSHPSHLLSSISPACLHDGYVCMVAAPPLSSISPALRSHVACALVACSWRSDFDVLARWLPALGGLTLTCLHAGCLLLVV